MPRPRAAGLDIGTGSGGGTMRRIGEMAGTRFDGVANPYVPPPTLAISDRLALHRDSVTTDARDCVPSTRVRIAPTRAPQGR